MPVIPMGQYATMDFVQPAVPLGTNHLRPGQAF
jgi:hypothetical protein